MTTETKRRLPIGAEPVEGGVHFRVWAPKRRKVEVVIDDRAVELAAEKSRGYFSGLVPTAKVGGLYRFKLDGSQAFPDPASRFQPNGPHEQSQVVDPTRFRWSDKSWRGIGPTRQVIYEMHIGTFTRAGTFAAAADELEELAGLGITTIEVMPVSEFPGRFGWGYDGVDLFAPYHHYGTPDDFRAFVDRAHGEGLAVILDVVYNHFGPDANYLGQYSDRYVSSKHKTEWGDGFNFDDEHAAPVREFVLANVRHWIAEYHLDGLRLDATHSIVDDSTVHILEEIGVAAREAAGDRRVVIVAETEPQDARIVRPRASKATRANGGTGYGLDMIWCDDFHHSAMVAATGRREAYFTDYRGGAQEFVSALKHGILYQGQRYSWQKKRRGAPAFDLDPHQCVFYLDNHDQVANTRYGERLHQLTSPGRFRALTAVFLLARQTPLIFQGQEFGSSAPFLFFADHNPELGKLVRTGRAEFMSQFVSMADTKGGHGLDDPRDPATFEQSRLDLTEREKNAEIYALHRDLIALRQCDPVLCEKCVMDGAVLGDEAFVVRYFAPAGADRLLVVNFGHDLILDIIPEPLLAPPDPVRGWRQLWHSEDPRYGGRGSAPLESKDGGWRIPGESATLLAGEP